jgi:hypothetical protein
MTTFTRRGWPQEWQDEFDVMMTGVLAWSKDIAEQRVKLLEEFDARRARLLSERGDQLPRPLDDWSEILLTHFRDVGAENLIKWYEAHTTKPTAFLHGGKLLNKPSIVGKTKRSEGGRVHHQRELITVMSWTELRALRANRLAQRDAAAASVALIDKLLELYVMCPEAASPQAAADILGLNLDEWLAGTS